MSDRSIPLFILAGRDAAPAAMPPEGRAAHPIVAYKGAELVVDGQPLVVRIRDTLAGGTLFDPILVVGPERLFARSGVPVIDVDAHLGTNVRCAVEWFLARFDAGSMAFITCDVLPAADEILAVEREYRTGGECALWYPLIRAPVDRTALGASAWKPEYRVRTAPDVDAIDVLPGHLVIADPRALRLALIYGLLDVAYRTRNRPVDARRRSMVRRVLTDLVVEDLRHVLGARPPTLTWTVMTSGLRLARGLRSGTLTVGGLERLVGRLALRRRHRRSSPARGVRLPVVDAIGLALDIDTEEEARASGAKRLAARDEPRP